MSIDRVICIGYFETFLSIRPLFSGNGLNGCRMFQTISQLSDSDMTSFFMTHSLWVTKSRIFPFYFFCSSVRYDWAVISCQKQKNRKFVISWLISYESWKMTSYLSQIHQSYISHTLWVIKYESLNMIHWISPLN